MLYQWSFLLSLILILSSLSRGAIVLERKPHDFSIVVRQGEQVISQPCGTKRPRIIDVETTLKECLAATRQPPFPVSGVSFERNIEAMHLVPYASTGADALKEAAVNAERERRQPQATVSSPNQFAVDRLIEVQENYLDYLDAGEKFVESTNKLELDLIRKSFRPTYSDGKLVFRFTDAVAEGNYEGACDGPWIPASLKTLLEVENLSEFVEWAQVNLPKNAPSVWVWHYYLEPTPIESREAYTDRDVVYQVTFSNALLDADSKALKSSLQFPSGTLVDTNDRRTLPALCFRRSSIEQLSEAGTRPAGNVTLQSLAQRYQQSNLNSFKRRILELSTIENAVGPAILMDFVVLPSTLEALQGELDQMFQLGKTRYSVLSAIVAEEKKKAKAEALAKQQAEYRRQQEEAEKKRQAQIAERQHQQEVAAYERRRQAERFTLDGKVWDNIAHYERANPGWKWNGSSFVGPPRTVSSSDDDGWITISPRSSSGRTTIHLSPRSSSGWSSGTTSMSYEWPDGSWRSTKYDTSQRYNGTKYYYSK